MNYSNGRMWDEYDKAMSRITVLEEELEKANAALRDANEDAERLVRNGYEFDSRDRSFNCVYCGRFSDAVADVKHSPDCPITLHRARVGAS